MTCEKRKTKQSLKREPAVDDDGDNSVLAFQPSARPWNIPNENNPTVKITAVSPSTKESFRQRKANLLPGSRYKNWITENNKDIAIEAVTIRNQEFTRMMALYAR